MNSLKMYTSYMKKEAIFEGLAKSVTSSLSEAAGIVTQAPGELLKFGKDLAILAAVPGVVIGAIAGAALSKITSPTAQDVELLQRKMLLNKKKKYLEERVKELSIMGVDVSKPIKRTEDLLNVRS